MVARSEPRAALTIGHPGHELRVHHWMERTKPVVFVLTDGSGGRDTSRIESTTALLSATGSRPGSIYGRWSDRAVYEAILSGNTGLFAGIVRELSQALKAEDVEYVVCDANEGYNPTHDLCYYLVVTAVRLCTREQGRQIQPYTFALIGPPDSCPEPLRAASICIRLDAPAIQRKLSSAGSYEELREEVRRALAKYGTAPFQTEWMLPVRSLDLPASRLESTPYYETYGEKQVAAGVYDQVIRYEKHFRPLLASLWHELGD